MTGDRFLVHGMGREPVEPDWPPLTGDEVEQVLSRLVGDIEEVVIEWHSPRPFSALAIVHVLSGGGDQRLVVKRHDRRVRDAHSLAEEHRFMRHLAARAIKVPSIVGPPLTEGGYVYEAQQVLDGTDAYRGAPSWTPYRSTHHAAAAGAALARLHSASTGFRASQRRLAPILAGTSVSTSGDPLDALARLAHQRPALGEFLAGRPWREEVGDAWTDLPRRFSPYATALEALWCHNDWHPSNLLWSNDSGGADVVGVIDFGLSNVTSACHDIATAIERSAIGWLDPPGHREVHLEHVESFLSAYATIRPFGAFAREALPRLLPIVHVEYALSEIDYFFGVVGSNQNAELAYEGYLLGHLRWFAADDGKALCAEVERLLC